MKLDNILYFHQNNNKIKLKFTDFSESKVIKGNSEINTIRGNNRHRPPEIYVH